MTTPTDDIKQRFETWAAKAHPWLLEPPESDADRLLRITALEAWQAALRFAALSAAPAALSGDQK